MIEEFLQASPKRETAITIGVFDGVHLGHRGLIQRTMNEASARGLLSVIVTFRNHPRTVLTPGFEPQYLTSLEQRLELIKSLGVDLVIPVTFVQAVAQLRAREFVSLLRDHLKMKVVVAGPDFAMGKGREGDMTTLSSLEEEMGFEVVCVDHLQLAGEAISSTTIREALASGDVAKAGCLLGRPFNLDGRVVVGEKRGHLLGFPTANMEIDQDRALPADGVYATIAYVGNTAHPAVTNIGVRPTFGELKHTKEVHIMDFQGDLYGQALGIDLIDRLRGEVRFSGPEELKAQITKDVNQAREVLTKA